MINKGADQQMHSLISAFVIRLLESIISKLATSKISIFKLVSVAEETGLSLALSETSKTGFVASRPILHPFFPLDFIFSYAANAGERKINFNSLT